MDKGCTHNRYMLIGWYTRLALKKIHIIFWGAMLRLRCCASFSLVVASGGYSLVVMSHFLAVVASLVAEHGL